MSTSDNNKTYVETSTDSQQPPFVFLFLAVHNDQSIMYNDSMSTKEAETRAKNSLTGLTIVSLHEDPILRSIDYNGLILRSAWESLPQPLFRRLKRQLVFRDKCCNQRNLADLEPLVITKRTETSRRVPANYMTVRSSYRYDRHVQENLTRPFEANPYLTGLDGPENSAVRYANHYRRVQEFIFHETRRLGGATADSRRIVVYHKLPIAIANWLVNDMVHLWPRLEFKFLGHTVSAKVVRTSPHCWRRVNHNVCVCEVCLTDEYAAQLVDVLQQTKQRERNPDGTRT